jgi:hypothetical protein
MGDAELARIRRLVHALVCRDRLSADLAAQRLTAYGVQRSTGEIGQDLQLASCQHCISRAAEAQQAEPERIRPVIHQAQSSGYLTGMIERDGR